MEVYWFGDSPLKLPGMKRTGTLDGIPEDSLVFIDDRSKVQWESIKAQRVYLVSDVPLSTPLPAQVVGVIPRDTMVIDAIITLCTEMRESYDLGDRLIKSLNEKELSIQEKQKALLRDSKRSRAIIRNATDLIFTLGPAGKITFSNETMKRYLKGGKESLVGSALTDFVVGENRDSVTEMIRKGFQKGVPSKIDVRLRLVKGDTGIFSLMSTPLVEDGRIYALSVIGRDITDIRSMQHRLSLQAKDLTLMINGLSHELRNPITVIGAYMKRIEKKEKGMQADSFASALSGIYSSIQRIEEMIERIEYYESIVNMKVEYREVNIGTLVRDVVGSMPGPIDAVIEGDLDIRAFSDERHIRDAFRRLLDNAVDTGSEKFEISLSRGDGYAYLSLRDYGPGIEGDVETLFAPFYSTDPVKIGLGLAEARIAMAKIGSSIKVVPQADPGAVFILKILLDRRNVFRNE